jgi:hypothetical protein
MRPIGHESAGCTMCRIRALPGAQIIGDSEKELKKSSRNQRENLRENTTIHRYFNSGDECCSW